MACRARPRTWTGAELLATIASVAFVAGVALWIAAADLVLAADIPLWNVALVICMVALLASVLSFPEWWSWAGGWGTNGRACSGARERRASHAVDLCRARSPRARKRPDLPGLHRVSHPGAGGPLTGRERRSHAQWTVAARQRDSMARLQRQHGRTRG